MDGSDPGCEETSFNLVMAEDQAPAATSQPLQNVCFPKLDKRYQVSFRVPDMRFAISRESCLIDFTSLQVPEILGPPPKSVLEADEKWTRTLRNLTSEIGFVKESLTRLKLEGVPAAKVLTRTLFWL
jgi:hypothetical protein